jgi:hypothetical protein
MSTRNGYLNSVINFDHWVDRKYWILENQFHKSKLDFFSNSTWYQSIWDLLLRRSNLNSMIKKSISRAIKWIYERLKNDNKVI